MKKLIQLALLIACLSGYSFGSAIRLNWNAVSVSPAVTNYKVYRGTSPGTETLLTTLGVVLTYDDTTAVPGTTYYYFTTAVNSNGEGPASNETHQVIPAGAVTVSPGLLTFPFGGGSQDVTVANGTASTITFTSITPTGGFTETHSCGSTLAAGLTCLIHVSRPVAGSSGTLTVIDNTGTHVVNLSALSAPSGSSLIGVWNITP